MYEKEEVGRWLRVKCLEEKLSLRQAAARTNLSHATISEIIKGSIPSAETVKKLAHGFGGDGNGKLALEDKLLVMAGYRTQRSEEALSEPMADLIDRLSGFSGQQLKLMSRFADFLATLEEK